MNLIGTTWDFPDAKVLSSKVKASANLRYTFLQNDINGHKRCLHIELVRYYGFTSEEVMKCYCLIKV